MPTHAPRPARHIAAALAGAALLALAEPAAAVTLTVTRLDDPAPDGCFPNDCSLREAVILANALAGADTVVLDAGMYQLTRAGSGEDGGLTGDLDVLGPLTLRGAGRTLTTVIGVGLGDRLVHAGAPLLLSDLRLENGTAPDGGAVLSTVDLELRSIAIAASSANRGGGVAWLPAVATVSLTASDCLFAGNLSTGAGGGGLMAEGPTIRLSRCTFDGNTALGGRGGGMFVDFSNSYRSTGGLNLLEVVDSHLEGNLADEGGGLLVLAGAAIMFDPQVGAQVSILRSTFSQNVAAVGLGGGLGVWHASQFLYELTVALTDSAFDGNTAGRGGGVATASATLVAAGVDFLGNASASSGGGLWIGSGILPASGQVFRSTFTGNEALGGGGGGIDAETGLEVRRSSFVGNTAALDGGGVLAGGGTVVARSTFSANQAAGAGGGVWAGDALVQVFSSTFRANTAGSGGTALHGGAATFGNQLRYSGNVISGTCGGGGFAYVTDGWNVESPGATCAPFGAATGDLLSVADGSLGLGGLQTDGRTWFYVPGAGSVARDRAAACADVDQRGYVAADSACDGGSIEVGATFPSFFNDSFENGLGAWSASQGG